MNCTSKDCLCLLISHKMLNWHPSMGTTLCCRISATMAGEYVAHILMREIEQGSLDPLPMDTINAFVVSIPHFL